MFAIRRAHEGDGMPLQPVCGKLKMPVESEADVRALFEAGLGFSEATLGRSRYEDYRRDLADHFYYVGAVCPQYFRPLQEEASAIPDDKLWTFDFTFPTWLYLLADAPESAVERLASRLRGSAAAAPLVESDLVTMLAAIGTPAALTALAEYGRTTRKRRQELANLGFWIPADSGPAEPRFARERRAVRVVRLDEALDDLARRKHPVGLPLEMVLSDSGQDVVTWHYCSLNMANVPGMPRLDMPQLHLVSPPLNCDWTLFCWPGVGGRYERAALSPQTHVDEREMAEMREEAIGDQERGRGYLELLPYDDELVYSNEHTERTPGVEGDVGGPPIGLYLNPDCPVCGKLMFHICTVTNYVREYGDGFRSLYACEECGVVASQAVGWN
jgi:hypothetical protein